MYVSRKKRNVPLSLPDTEAFMPDARNEANEANEASILREIVSSETSAEGEMLEIGRDMILEPEDESWRYDIDSEYEDDGNIGEEISDADGEGDVSVQDDPQDLDDGDAEREEE